MAICRPAEAAAESTMLSIEDEAIVVAFRRHTPLPLDDCLYALQPTIPHLTRSSLHRCLQRHNVSRLPEVEGNKQGCPRATGFLSAGHRQAILLGLEILVAADIIRTWRSRRR